MALQSKKMRFLASIARLSRVLATGRARSNPYRPASPYRIPTIHQSFLRFVGVAGNSAKKYAELGQNIVDFFFFAADCRNEMDFRAFEICFIHLIFPRQGGARPVRM
jgi:hypothetical protein